MAPALADGPSALGAAAAPELASRTLVPAPTPAAPVLVSLRASCVTVASCAPPAPAPPDAVPNAPGGTGTVVQPGARLTVVYEAFALTYAMGLSGSGGAYEATAPLTVTAPVPQGTGSPPGCVRAGGGVVAPVREAMAKRGVQATAEPEAVLRR